jgi:hypothetical protein
LGRRTLLWELRTNGDFYSALSLFEDQRGQPDALFFNTRIVRIAEAFLFCARLYERLNVDARAEVTMLVRHDGLEDRTLRSATPSRSISTGYRCSATSSQSEVVFQLGQLESRLTDLVKAVCTPLFELFDFFELDDAVYEQIINDFVAGRVS